MAVLEKEGSRALDALFAEHIYGWSGIESDDTHGYVGHPSEHGAVVHHAKEPVPLYSHPGSTVLNKADLAYRMQQLGKGTEYRSALLKQRPTTLVGAATQDEPRDYCLIALKLVGVAPEKLQGV